jgi:serine protease SohB
MEFLAQYGLFLAQVLTLVVAVVVVMALGFGLSQKSKVSDKPELKVERLNDEFEHYQDILDANLMSKAAFKAQHKLREAEEKAKHKQEKASAKALVKAAKTDKPSKAEAAPAESDPRKKRVFVLSFDGDVKASGVENLARAVTAVLMVADAAKDEVVVRLESPGGLVHGYGLAAAQLQRIRDKGIPLTATIDKVAASGGYMMAVVANRIVAAPFAIVGSIGVVAQIPNFNRVLKKHEVDLELHTAGEYKRTLTLFGENTQEGREKFKQELEETHGLFKAHIENYRSGLNLSEVATGEHWYGKQAKTLNLVDDIMTSDQYLAEAVNDADVFEISFEARKTIADKLAGLVSAGINTVVNKGLGRFGVGRASEPFSHIRAQSAAYDNTVMNDSPWAVVSSPATKLPGDSASLGGGQ